MNISLFKNILLIVVVASSCTIIKKAPKNGPFLVKNNIVLQGGKFNKIEKQTVLQRLSNQLDDSSKVVVKDAFFILHTIKKPIAYDTAYSSLSAKNMQKSMYHLGYYNAVASYTQDTVNKKVTVNYTVTAGKPTIIDTVSYRLKNTALQQIAIDSKADAILVKNEPVTELAVLGEISRLVDSFRNNGYYKFTAAELRVRGDTTLAALTTISDDPFEQLKLLNEAQQQRDSPKIKLALVINKPLDSTKLDKYYINKIYILSDFRANDVLNDTSKITQRKTKSFILRYHENLFRTALFARNITFRNGDLFRQSAYLKTLSNLSRLGVWQNVNIKIIENLDVPNTVDLVIELVPAKKFSFENSIDASYSTSNVTNLLGGNLFGFAINLTLKNKNIAKEAISMTHTLRAGVELNNKNKSLNNSVINSDEFSYSNNILIPRLIKPIQNLANKFKTNLYNGETFVNTGVSLSNRFNLFSLQTFNLALGLSANGKKERKFTFKPINAQFSYLYNQSFPFDSIIAANPFLRYSYNTSFILGLGASYSSIYRNPIHLASLQKERNFKVNFEESGLTTGALPILIKYKKQYVKIDVEYKYTVSKRKSALAYRFFAGVGVPIFGDTALPFFKQFFGGGSNSMRGWPIRGVGRGSQKLAPFTRNNFNDRTGDMQLETNIEFRHDIARLVPDLITLKGAAFIDVGNIWNIKQSTGTGVSENTKFDFKNLYKDLGLSAGYGFRIDFTYLILRTDFSFRFKRPETSDVNNGWKAPPISFNDAFKKIFSASDASRLWRYENFNFTVGINYPF